MTPTATCWPCFNEWCNHTGPCGTKTCPCPRRLVAIADYGCTCRQDGPCGCDGPEHDEKDAIARR